MAVYSGQALLLVTKNRKALNASLKKHLKVNDYPHGTDQCDYCRSVASEIGLLLTRSV
jgi:hypothetical protein